MKKTFFTIALACIAAGASAFDLKVGGISITQSTDADLLGNGKAMVEFRKSAKQIRLSLTDVTLPYLGSGFAVEFEGDADFNTLCIDIAGTCNLTSADKGIAVTNGKLILQQSNTGSTINFTTNEVAFALDEAQIIFGSERNDLGDLEVNVTINTKDYTIWANPGKINRLLVAYAHINFSKPDEIALMYGDFDDFFTGAAFTPDVTYKSSFLYEGEDIFTGTSLIVEHPFPISVGNVSINKNNCKDFNPGSDILTSGSISYDPEKNILTLNNVSLKEGIAGMTDNLTISLKGHNTIRSKKSSPNKTPILIIDDNLTITGDPDATLTLWGDESDGIRCGSNITIDGINKLTMYSVIIGIGGSFETYGQLTIGRTIIDINASDRVIDNFSSVKMPDKMFILLPADCYFSEIEHTFVTVDEINIETPAKALFLGFDTYNFTLCDVAVTGQNYDNIRVPGTTGKATYFPSSNTLVLNNFDASALTESPNPLYVSGKLNIYLVGNNTLATNDRAIDIFGDQLVIYGNGSLTLNSTNSGILFNNLDARLEVRDGAKLNINADNYGIRAEMPEFNCAGGMGMGEGEMGGGGMPDRAPTIAINNAIVNIADTYYEGFSNILELEIDYNTMAVTKPDNAYFISDCSSMIHGITVDGATYTTDFITIEPKNGIVTALENNSSDNTANSAVKLIENGTLVIIRDGIRYNAQGALID